ncbi:metalloregulator ArsR/SmtB family transcription factor [Shimazuella sp. AN120528]|uniref:ArsR/SmtB family transcription factor n=1 Tax=Shimazuella soli TaxID=1892854 RepID=UPI001F0D697B|nr:metalloregulator ArsR/SmtB family transcription factor [Shimazuella soli]MCH5585617.1 metalloregulator ArsR/SmtB family transcription factor [Shimazuella soli]
MDNDVCSTPCEESEKVNTISERLKQEDFVGITELYRALADENRLKIAYALLLEEELCVCEIANAIGTSVATASHHLRFLRKKGLAKHRKLGKMVYYSLDDEHVKQLVEIAFIHRKEGRCNE